MTVRFAAYQSGQARATCSSVAVAPRWRATTFQRQSPRWTTTSVGISLLFGEDGEGAPVGARTGGGTAASGASCSAPGATRSREGTAVAAVATTAGRVTGVAAAVLALPTTTDRPRATESPSRRSRGSRTAESRRLSAPMAPAPRAPTTESAPSASHASTSHAPTPMAVTSACSGSLVAQALTSPTDTAGGRSSRRGPATARAAVAPTHTQRNRIDFLLILKAYVCLHLLLTSEYARGGARSRVPVENRRYASMPWQAGTRSGVRWESLFDDLEGQLEAADSAEFEAELRERERVERARVRVGG